MRSFMYLRLAIVNIKKNYRVYIPYILASIFTIVMFYNMMAISIDKGLASLPGAQSIGIMLGLGVNVIGIFAIFIILYTHNFLIKRRKKEFALYNILGMEKKHIARVLCYETIITYLIVLFFGIGIGILFNKLFVLIYLKIIGYGAIMGFQISYPTIQNTIVLLSIIYLLTLVKTIIEVSFAKPIELMNQSKSGEKEPRIKWFLLVVGVICLGCGYYLANAIKSPLEAFTIFFIAVILVIIGTYFLFITGTIFIFKLLKNNKKYYYQANHFISISSLMYRMKQNAVGLANICILSTMVLVVLSTSVCLYFGINDSLNSHFGKDINVQLRLDNYDEYKRASEVNHTMIDNSNLEVTDFLEYCYFNVTITRNKNIFETEDVFQTFGIMKFISLNDYNRITNSNYQLNNDEALINTSIGLQDNLIFDGKEFNIIKTDVTFDDTESKIYTVETYFVVVNDEVFKELVSKYQNCIYRSIYNLSGSAEDEIAFVDNYNIELVNDDTVKGFVDSIESSRTDFRVLYGGFLFIGLFLGTLFTIATVLIIYYKQIQEGYDDASRYEMMKKVGLDEHLVKKAINTQVLLVFFLPLLVSIIHIIFAFKVITQLLVLLNLTNVKLFTICLISTVIVFAICYTIVYYLTSRVYYKIVYSKY